MAQRREQVLAKRTQHQQLDSMLAEFREQHIKAAKGTKVAHAIVKKQSSVGEDYEAVPIVPIAVAGVAVDVAASSAVAGDAGEVVASSAVAGEARAVVAGSAVAWGGRAICCLLQRCTCT